MHLWKSESRISNILFLFIVENWGTKNDQQSWEIENRDISVTNTYWNHARGILKMFYLNWIDFLLYHNNLRFFIKFLFLGYLVALMFTCNSIKLENRKWVQSEIKSSTFKVLINLLWWCKRKGNFHVHRSSFTLRNISSFYFFPIILYTKFLYIFFSLYFYLRHAILTE